MWVWVQGRSRFDTCRSYFVFVGESTVQGVDPFPGMCVFFVVTRRYPTLFRETSAYASDVSIPHGWCVLRSAPLSGPRPLTHMFGDVGLSPCNES